MLSSSSGRGGETQQKAEISTGAIMIKVVLKIANGQ